MPEESAQTVARIEKWARGIFIIAALGLIAQVAKATYDLRSKSAIEQRLDLLESAKRDQQKRNEGVDDFLKELMRHAR